MLTDSRRLIYPDSTLFFALYGKRREGHEFIPDLYLRGVRNFMIYQSMHMEDYPDANFILVKVKDGQKVASELQKLGIITRPVNGYQLPEWLRITVGTVAENERCLAGLEKVLSRSQESAS